MDDLEEPPKEGEAAPELSLRDKGAAKYVQSLTQNLLAVGMSLNALGCTYALRADSGFGTNGQFGLLVCAVCYFLMSTNTAALANAIEGREHWLEAAFQLAWIQCVYLIIYLSLLTFKVSKTAISSGLCGVLPIVPIAGVSCYWAFLFGRPKLVLFFVSFMGRHIPAAGNPPYQAANWTPYQAANWKRQ